MDETISASGICTFVGAGIAILIIAVVADFDALMEDAIAAAGIFAVIEAGITFIDVSIIASFNIEVKKAVTAASLETTAGTRVTIFPVTVITSLALIDAVVAATLNLTNAVAAVTGISIAVIASLNPSAHHTITASGKNAAI